MKKEYYDELSDVEAYLNEIGKISLLTKDEEQKLGFLLLQGDAKAKERLIESNLRLVVCIAKKYLGRGLGFKDLIQTGNLALHEAINNYDVRKGVSISVYAGVYIDGVLKSVIAETSRNIKLSKTYFYLLHQIIRVQNNMFMKLKRFPTNVELAHETGVRLPLIESLLRYKDDTRSLNEIIETCDGEVELGDSIVDLNTDVEESVIENEFVREMSDLINHKALSTREREILYSRYEHKMTFDEIGKLYGITRQAVDRIEKRALKKLRRIIDVNKMSVYLDYPEKGKKFIKEMML